MNKLLTFALSSILLTAPLAASQAAPIGPKPGELTPVRGFQLGISAQSDTFGGGRLIAVDVDIKNVSGKGQTLGWNFNPCLYHIEVIQNGAPVPLTRFGQAMASPDSVGGIEMPPDDSVKDSLPISRLYDMSQAGVYLVTVKHSIIRPGDKGLVDATSNTLRITVF